MLNRDLYRQFLQEIPVFDEKIHAFEAGEIDRNTFKGISGGFGSYAQRGGEKSMLRLRIPGGRLTKEKLKFVVDVIAEYQVDKAHFTTCQTIQLHNLSAAAACGIMEKAFDVGIITRGGGGDFPQRFPCGDQDVFAPEIPCRERFLRSNRLQRRTPSRAVEEIHASGSGNGD